MMPIDNLEKKACTQHAISGYNRFADKSRAVIFVVRTRSKGRLSRLFEPNTGHVTHTKR